MLRWRGRQRPITVPVKHVQRGAQGGGAVVFAVMESRVLPARRRLESERPANRFNISMIPMPTASSSITRSARWGGVLGYTVDRRTVSLSTSMT